MAIIIQSGKTYYLNNTIGNTENTVYVIKIHNDNNTHIVEFADIFVKNTRIDGYCSGKLASNEKFLDIKDFRKKYTTLNNIIINNRDYKLIQLGIGL